MNIDKCPLCGCEEIGEGCFEGYGGSYTTICNS